MGIKYNSVHMHCIHCSGYGCEKCGNVGVIVIPQERYWEPKRTWKDAAFDIELRRGKDLYRSLKYEFRIMPIGIVGSHNKYTFMKAFSPDDFIYFSPDKKEFKLRFMEWLDRNLYVNRTQENKEKKEG